MSLVHHRSALRALLTALLVLGASASSAIAADAEAVKVKVIAVHATGTLEDGQSPSVDAKLADLRLPQLINQLRLPHATYAHAATVEQVVEIGKKLSVPFGSGGNCNVLVGTPKQEGRVHLQVSVSPPDPKKSCPSTTMEDAAPGQRQLLICDVGDGTFLFFVSGTPERFDLEEGPGE